MSDIIIETIQYIKVGDVEHPIDAVTVGGKTIPGESQLLPTVTNNENGKILRVVNGEWTLVSPSSIYSEFNGIDCPTEESEGPIIHNYAEEYLTFDILTSGNIGWIANGEDSSQIEAAAKTIQYSINNGAWTSITSTATTTIAVQQGDTVRFKGTNDAYATSNKIFSGFGDKKSVVTNPATFNVSGNIMSLTYGDQFIGQTTLTSNSSYNYCCLFDGSKVVSCENLVLPATTLTPHCYRALFANCKSLVDTPVLPATSLADSCYRYMFNMDTALTTAPDLLATTLVSNCYNGMFNGCTHLNYIKCMATNHSASDCTSSWVQNVAATGTFVKDTATSWTTGISAIPEGWVVVNLGLVTPTLSHSGNTVSMSCDTTNATIYYRVGSTGEYQEYTTPITIDGSVTVSAYATIDGENSNTVTETYTYVSDPVISFSENTITISCTTSGATIYYRLGTTGEFQTYSAPIEINTDTTVYTYASLNGTNSTTVSENCTYVEPYIPGDSDSDSDIIIVSEPVISYSNNTVTITCETPSATIYYKLGESSTYQTYSAPIALTATTTVYTYASLSGVDSEVVSENFVHNYSLDYLTLDILTSGTVMWKADGSNATKTISYSINDGAWTDITSTSGGVTFNVSAGDVVKVKGSNTQYCNANKSNYSHFGGTSSSNGTATYNVSGNIMSLTAGDNFASATTLPGTWTFCQIFKYSKAVSAENLVLPALTMTECCYRAMFSYATLLEKAPVLPATTLAKDCYWYMFERSAITTAPDLLATTLVQECYGHMFTDCNSLNYIKCMATSGFGTSKCLEGWVTNVASTGTFVKDSNTTWTLNSASGIPTGWTVWNSEVVVDPVISFNGEQIITITCETTGADIYYRLGTTGNFSLYTGPILINEDTTVYAYASKNNQDSSTISQSCTYSEHIYTFAGVQMARGPLYYGSNGYEIKDSWNYSSYNSVYGETVGSYSFNFINMGTIFEKAGFSTSDEDIENMLDPFDGWRLPSKDEWASIVGTTRAGSTVNNSANKHYAVLQLTGVTHSGNSASYGLLIFPDGETITGTALSNMDTTTANTGITNEQLNEYLNQGCVYLPCSGYYHSGYSSWYLGGTYGYYLSSGSYSTPNNYFLSFSSNSLNAGNNIEKSNRYMSVRLVKNIDYGTESPFEGANKDLNENWVI